MVFGIAVGHMVLGMIMGLLFGAAVAARRSRAARSNWLTTRRCRLARAIRRQLCAW